MRQPVPAKVQVTRFFRMVLPATAVIVGGCLLVFGVLIYRATHPAPVPEPVNPSHYLLPSVDVVLSATGRTRIVAWWIPGLRGSPGIVLAPGLGMSRADALSLASALHEKGFNLLVYDQRGSGANPKEGSTLGWRETDDLVAALEFTRRRPEVDARRMGVWGVDVGAWAALAAAASYREIRAIALDSAYESVDDFLAVRLRSELGAVSRLLEVACAKVFRLYRPLAAGGSDWSLRLDALADRSVLFIQGDNRKDMARLTALLFDRVQPQKEMISIPSSRVRMMSGEEQQNYDRQVSNFFHLNLPVRESLR